MMRELRKENLRSLGKAIDSLKFWIEHGEEVVDKDDIKRLEEIENYLEELHEKRMRKELRSVI